MPVIRHASAMISVVFTRVLTVVCAQHNIAPESRTGGRELALAVTLVAVALRFDSALATP
jgi:hypothetical protein